jgi:hypothetical protein
MENTELVTEDEIIRFKLIIKNKKINYLNQKQVNQLIADWLYDDKQSYMTFWDASSWTFLRVDKKYIELYNLKDLSSLTADDVVVIEWLGWELRDRFLERMDQWVDNNKRKELTTYILYNWLNFIIDELNQYERVQPKYKHREIPSVLIS